MNANARIFGAGPISKVKATAVRAARSAAQAALVALGGDVINAWSVDWHQVAGVSLGMGVVSVLTSIAFPPPEAGVVVTSVGRTER